MDQESVLPRILAYHLLEEMTNGFAEDRELGRGTYGKVYLGLHKDGEEIAVKMLRPMLGLDDEQFEKEYHNLERLQHQNIVRLVGYCNETRREFVSFEGKRVLSEVTHRALCFEYMQNGSLDNCLSDESSGHDWHTRYAIIKGICKGLQYLHEELNPPIFHLDLKPANVLLDKNRVAKIADFGLSRLMGQEGTRITTSSIGTIGYLPPEYINRHVISNKLDIFSLGVIIIKIMAGPTGYSQSAEMSSQDFIDLVNENWRNRLQAESLVALESYCEQIKICMRIALSCVEVDRHKRPTIGDIVNELNEAEIMGQFFDALLDNKGSSMHQVCHCISTESELLEGLPNKLISSPLQITDNSGKVHQVTLMTIGDSADETRAVKPDRPAIKIISCRENMGLVVSIDVHPTEPWILVGHMDGHVSIWNHQTQAKVTAMDITDERGLFHYLFGKRDNSQSWIRTAKFIARKEWFVAGDSHGYLHVHVCMTMEKLRKIKAHADWVNSLAVHPSHPFVLSASSDNLIKLWNWESGMVCIRTFEAHSLSVRQVKFNPQTASDTFASISGDSTVKIWNIFSPIPISTLDCRPDNLETVDYFPAAGDQLYVVTGSWLGIARIWDLRTSKCVQQIKGLQKHDCGVAVVDCLPDQPILITTSEDRVVSLCNSSTHRYHNRVAFKLGPVLDFAYIKGVRSVVVGFKEAIAIMEIK